MKEFITNLLSLAEDKKSAVIIGFLGICAMAVWKMFKIGDIPPNAKEVIIYLGALIIGVNGIPAIQNIISTVKNNSTSV